MRDFDPRKIPKPPGLKTFDWTQTQNYIALELGCGNGMHTILYAKKYPSRTMIAIEQTQNRSEAFLKRLSDQPDLSNIYAIRADAVWWCAHNLEGQQVDEIFILYPNPYHKESQANKRYHNMPFMGFLLTHLKSGGQLTLASNIESYVAEAEDRFVSDWDLSLKSKSEIPKNASPRTSFEKKYLDRGEKCINLVFEK